MKRIFFGLMLLGLFDSNAFAEWTQVTKGTGDFPTAYVDFDSIQKKGNTVKMWYMLDYKQPKQGPSGTQFSSMLVYSENECSQRMSRGIGNSFYKLNMGVGDTIHSDFNVNEWEPVIPGSMGGYMWQIACGKK